MPNRYSFRRAKELGDRKAAKESLAAEHFLPPEEPAPAKTSPTEVPAPQAKESLPPEDSLAAEEFLPVIEVRAVDGFLMVPNWMRFGLFPQIRKPFDRFVYMELYGRTHGSKGNPASARLSQTKLAKTLGVSEPTLLAALVRLETLGLVSRPERRIDGEVSGRGTLFVVHLPRIVGAGKESEAGKRTKAAKEPLPAKEPAPHEKTHTQEQTVILSTLRAIARSYRGDDVAERLREWFRTERLPVDEAAIREALAGMGR